MAEKELKDKITDLEGVICTLKADILSSQTQLDILKQDKEKLIEHHESVLTERENENKAIIENFNKALIEKQENESKWKIEFEKMRTINMNKEQQLLDDFEWKLRDVEKKCKTRLLLKDEDLNKKLEEAKKETESKCNFITELQKQVECRFYIVCQIYYP